MKFRLLVGFLVLGCRLSASAEVYIIPMYAHGLLGGTAGWESIVLVSNAGDQDAHVLVQSVLSLQEGPCEIFPCNNAPLVVPPRITTSLLPVQSGTTTMRAGAFVLSSDLPVTVETWVRGSFRDGGETYQTIPVVSAWIPANMEISIPRFVTGLANESINIFAVNPNAVNLVVDFPNHGTQPDLQPMLVPPKSTSLRRATIVITQPGASQSGRALFFSCSDPCMVLTSNGALTRMPVIAH
jgi:hypothetical protein